MNADYCVCCGEYAPEGTQVCRQCENKYIHKIDMYNEIYHILTNFGHNNKPIHEGKVNIN